MSSKDVESTTKDTETPTCTSKNNSKYDDDDYDDDDYDYDAIERAASAIRDAHFVLILAGAGFSADSGLSTYETMPDEYRELCNPLQLIRNRQRFQQFWYNFATTYAKSEPHEGYRILDEWLSSSPSLSSSSFDTNNNNDNENGNDNATNTASTSTSTKSTTRSLLLPHFQECWVYTSNVDGHFRQYPNSFQHRICEIHGYAGEFRCPCKMGLDPTGKERQGPEWEEWNRQTPSDVCSTKDCNDFVRNVGTETGDTNTTTITTPDMSLTCNHCDLPLRPNVLMFHDTDINILSSINHQRARYQTWEANMEDEVVMNGKRVVILEFGCGLNVPAVRIESEEVLGDCLERINSIQENSNSGDGGGGSATLIRVNPKDAKIDNRELRAHAISIYATSLNAIRNIDKALRRQLN